MSGLKNTGMQVHKFGGASVTDADGMRRLAEILRAEADGNSLVVVSAMGKTTNALERVVSTYLDGSGFDGFLQEVTDAHLACCNELFEGDRLADCRKYVLDRQTAIVEFLRRNKSKDYAFIYDQVVSSGELLSSYLLQACLDSMGLACTRVDVRDLVITDHSFTDAVIDWKATASAIKTAIPPLIEKGHVIAQGFLGATPERITTTLGREGSDFSAAIFAHCLDARSMTVWKNVPGILTADPRLFPDAVKLDRIDYREAIEMAFYGAQVLHPKTIKPLQNKGIPLHVRSFLEPGEGGTVIADTEDAPEMPPIIVFKEKQVLLSFSVRDFSFVGEDSLRSIFEAFAAQQLRIRMMQNKAISFSVCIDDRPEKIRRIIESLNSRFEIRVQDGLQLLTVRHPNEGIIESLCAGKNQLIQQKAEVTVQVLMY